MNRLVFPALTFAAVLVSFAACNSNNNPPVGPTPGPTCTLPPGVQSVLVYPAPSATAVVDNTGTLVIGSTTALDSTQWQLVFADAVFPRGVALPLSSATPPFPAPTASPSFANPQYQQGSTGVPFQTNQIVTVFLNNRKASNNCTPLQIGQFST
jgi:hypothetical protein